MTIHPVVLRDELSGKYVEAELIERVDSGLAKRAEDSWQTFIGAENMAAAAEGRPFPHLAHGHWQWEKKVQLTERLLPYPTLGIVCRDEVQGLMLLETDGHFGRLDSQTGSPLVYVNLLATAPWNLAAVVEAPRYRGVGTIMMAAAATMSQDLGFKGRMSLHSLRGSESWYERLGLYCLGPDTEKQDLKYYEATPEVAHMLIHEEGL